MAKDKLSLVNTYWSSNDCNNINIISPLCSANWVQPPITGWGPIPDMDSSICSGCMSHTYFPEMVYNVCAFFEYHTK